MLDFQNQECSLTLREGVEHYRAYLKKNGKKVLDDQEDSLTILSHDATHVIYGLDTSLEEEQMLNFWTLFGTTYTWKEIMAYNGREEVSDFTKDLLKELGVINMVMLTIRSIVPFFQVLRNLRLKKKKWSFVPPNELMDRSVSSLREEYGIKILTPEERNVKKIQWSGSILE
jgi:hypothetical protein|tara:strand:- start:808 stop:1323 length:516 start_codon:yes stop_codon:yes gene_type:complete